MVPLLSYAITVCNEPGELKRLVFKLEQTRNPEDEVVVLWDNRTHDREIKELLDYWEETRPRFRVFKGHFDGDFSAWKNRLTSHCYGEYIFQLDADEYPSDYLLEALPSILKAQPEIEAYHVPRINTVEGLTPEHVAKWGWRVSPEGYINFPDPQWRIWKNKPYIKWVNKVHERLDGFKTFAVLPSEEAYCLYHPKTIARQEKQNALYDTY